MKKQFGLAVASIAALLLLGACSSDNPSSSASSSEAASSSSLVSTDSSSTAGSSAAVAGDYKDGEYRVEAKDFDDKGWKEYVVVRIADGKISDAEYNAVDKDGKLKTDDADYKENMNAANKTYPEKYMKELTDQLVEKQETEDVEAVTGATHSSTNFVALANEALSFAVKGETGTHAVDLSE
ncbi:hypothetical protein BAU15_13210 [Enterococcus sp. JM4C]|uniref:FMN-binding protein n=1 Tax=Candidatus Enterococcus huntleyi TaxID=1857217 RepID=UPI001379B6F1|nr:FMN-binding protein [Enterococcus sp. JM4C]KAF1297718.1 hypothetical protein BAU15_13210 [Enterococcus sp. JM4C]